MTPYRLKPMVVMRVRNHYQLGDQRWGRLVEMVSSANHDSRFHPNDSVTAPLIKGSGGGLSGAYNVGGAGGGLVQLNVTETLSVDGRISADGFIGSGTRFCAPWEKRRSMREKR